MMPSLHRAARALVIVVFAAGCATTPPTAPPVDTTTPGPDPNVLPGIEREFRGLWVATVSNIDWPSSPGLSVTQQQAELESIMDRAVNAGLTAIVFHVRPAGDALYESSIEPWGRMLTGTQGVSPGYDPLAFAVQQAHRRGLELHAWVNPFRAGNSRDSTSLASTHLFHTRRDLVRVYGTQLWMDPGEPDVHDHSMRVIRDIVARYDVDAIHLDDYFYPYPQSGVVFPDSAAYAQYGGTMSLANWRRNNVDRFVERLYTEVHEVKPWVRVGISPFGIWRPGNPEGIVGLDAYEAIYADARKWLLNGWLDYLAPQLYWRIDPPQQSFPALLAWWLQQNAQNRYIWPGLATYRLYEGTPLFTTSEIVNQVKITRQQNAGGMLFYNTTTTVTRNSGQMATALANQVFTQRAIAPPFSWLDAQAPAPPTLGTPASTSGSWRASVQAAAGEPVRFWVVRSRASNRWSTRVIDGTASEIVLTTTNGAFVDWVVVNAVDRVGNVSGDVVWR
jgi:uncharacterized lipoprotein YddW (UPF0748 family)